MPSLTEWMRGCVTVSIFSCFATHGLCFSFWFGLFFLLFHLLLKLKNDGMAGWLGDLLLEYKYVWMSVASAAKMPMT